MALSPALGLLLIFGPGALPKARDSCERTCLLWGWIELENGEPSAERPVRRWVLRGLKWVWARSLWGKSSGRFCVECLELGSWEREAQQGKSSRPPSVRRPTVCMAVSVLPAHLGISERSPLCQPTWGFQRGALWGSGLETVSWILPCWVWNNTEYIWVN